MTKRLYQNKNFINFILIYYSTFLILSSVTAKYFEWYNSELDSYFNIIFSVVLLVTSLINANAKYLERIEKINATIIKLETLEYSNDLSNKEYKSIIEDMELRGEQDYYQTAMELIYDDFEEILKKSLEKSKTRWQYLRVNGIVVFKITIFILPVIIIFICIWN